MNYNMTRHFKVEIISKKVSISTYDPMIRNKFFKEL